MHKYKKTNFSQLVCSARYVREAFVSHRPSQLWWNAILALHGKPLDSGMELAGKTQLIAAGFKFYAWLYRVLSVIFLLLAPTFATFNVAESITSSYYWAAVSMLAGLYLWCVSSLGYAGATSYSRGHASARSSLVAFMVMIVVFLSMFVAVISVVASTFAWLPTTPNLAGASCLLIFGVGSYMIEIIYLTAE